MPRIIQVCLVAALGLVVGLAGCGKARKDVLAEYASRGAAKRAELAALVAVFPPAGAVRAPSAPASLDPKPVYAPEGECNVAFLMFEHLADPDAKPGFDLLLDGALLSALQWTGPKNPMADSALNESAGDLARQLDRAFAARYLVVSRVTRHEQPTIVDETAFRGGLVELEVFVVDAQSRSVVASFPVSAKPPATVDYLYKPGEDRKARQAAFAHSTMFSSARQQIGRQLPQLTGGTFKVNW